MIPFRISLKQLLLFALISVALSAPQDIFAQQRVTITGKTANLRSGPGTNHDILWQVEQFHPFIVIEKKGNWYHIRDFENDTSWVHESLVGNIESVITIKSKCNIRSGPSTKDPIVFTTEMGVPFKVLKKQGNWLNIEHADGDVGWVHNSLVW